MRALISRRAPTSRVGSIAPALARCVEAESNVTATLGAVAAEPSGEQLVVGRHGSSVQRELGGSVGLAGAAGAGIDPGPSGSDSRTKPVASAL